MTPDEAKQLIFIHSALSEDVDHAKWSSGFLGSLRPYRGLNEENYHEVMAAIRVLAPQFNQEMVERDLISAIWQMCHYARDWGVHPAGMLRRNDLITAEHSERLEVWIDAIEYAVHILLHSDDLEEAFAAYRQSLR